MSPRKARRLPTGLPRKPRGGRVGRTRVPGGDGEAGGPAPGLGPEHTESAPDGDWVIRLVPGAAAVKTYRCPGCDQEIRPGTPHVVIWPAHTPGPDERRHWHATCWDRRLQRHVPRYRGSR